MAAGSVNRSIAINNLLFSAKCIAHDISTVYCNLFNVQTYFVDLYLLF